jgi:hypothetical protein
VGWRRGSRGTGSAQFVAPDARHTSNFSDALLGVNPPELQVADNDYAVGLLVQTIASGQYVSNTQIFVIKVLGLNPLNLNDATALLMTDVFDVNQFKCNYAATPWAMLYHGDAIAARAKRCLPIQNTMPSIGRK